MAEPGSKRPARNPRYKYSALRRQLTLDAAAQGGVLRPWMKALGLWYVGHVRPPTAADTHTYAKRLASADISRRAIDQLIQNPVWQAFVRQCDDEVVSRAKAHAESKLMTGIEAHFEAIEDLRANKKWADLVKYTNPLLERIWPTSDGPRMPAQIVQIMIGAPGSFAATHAKGGPVIDIATIEEAEATGT